MKRFFAIILLAFLGMNNINAYDFSAVCESGQTLYYNITSNLEPFTVEITSENATEPYYTAQYHSTSDTIPYYSTYPVGVLTIPSFVTYNNINYSVTNIGSHAFYGCNGLTSITIPNTITSIGDYAFYGCHGLTSVSIPNSITNISHSAFSCCARLISLIMPNSVTNIGDCAFSGCSDLISVYYTGNLAQWCEISFGGHNANPLNSAHNLYIGDTLVTDLIIPSTIPEVKDFAFDGAECITSVDVSASRIGSNAFRNCSNMTSATIGNSVTSIGGGAFFQCSIMESLNFNATNCTSMEEPFLYCPALTTIIIGNNVTNIPYSAFCGCNITSVTIPSSVTNIGDYAFKNCRRLTTINFNATNCNSMERSVWNECSSLSTLNIGDNVTRVPDNAFYNCSGLAGTLFLPNSITSIGSYAFYNCNGLTGTLSIPNFITSIGDFAFYGCAGLVGIDFNAINCTTMGSLWCPVFQSCTSLSTINIAENVINIPDYAFYKCTGISSIILPSSVSSIGKCAFKDCSSLNTVYFNATNCTVMGNPANPVFLNCSQFNNLSIGDNVVNIPAYSFYKCKELNSPQIPNSVLTIGDSAFYMVPNIVYSGSASGCPWGALSVNGYYEDGLFYTSMAKDTLVSALGTLVSVSIPNTVVSILPNAFNGCVALRYLTIGQSVRNIGNNAFSGCTSLDSITIGSSVKNIGGYAFSGCTRLSNVNVPDSVEIIGEYAFNACSSLTTLTIGSSVKNIGGYAFSGCTRLSNVNVPDSVEIIGEYAFNACSNLTTFTIGESVNRIGQYAFRNCQNLTTMNFNATSCSTMSRNTFTGCSSLSTLNIGKNVTRIPENAFYNCDKLAGDLIIPDSVTNIDDDCFYGCTRLTTVTIGKSATYIGSYAFNNCSGLTDIYVKAITPPSMFSSYTFSNYSATLWVPCGYSETYASATGWNSFSDIRESRTYLLNVESSNLQKGTVKITQHPNCNDGIAIISATPKGRFRFERWNDGNTDNPRTIVVESDTAFTATFTIAQYTITLVSIDETMGSVSESGIYDYGSEIQISATPAEHYHFVRWNDYITDNPRTITVTGDATYTAYFTIDEHTVTVTENNSAMGATWGSGNYDFGSEIDIAAYPRYGYAFLSWNDGNTETPRTIIVESDTTFTAIFATARTVTIESSDNEMGYVIGSGEYAEGAEIEITAIPYEGYRFDHWVDVDNPSRDFNTDNPRTIVVSTDVTYMAVFTDVVGIEDNGVPAISVFPNPTSDILNITSSETISEIEIVNSLGQVVYRAEVNADNAVCDVNGLSNGVYLVRIQSKGAVVVQRRFVKE